MRKKKVNTCLNTLTDSIASVIDGQRNGQLRYVAKFHNPVVLHYR